MNKVVVMLYKFSRWLWSIGVPVLPSLVTALIRYTHSAWIPASARIGEGIVFGYGGLCVVIHARAKIGRNCKIDQGVTIGGKSGHFEVPEIGDDVFIGAGAKVLGPIIIGNNVVIGANSVVVKDVPDNTIVAGVPAKVIKRGIISRDYF